MVDATDFVLVRNTVAMIGDRYEFLTERADNELRRRLFIVGLAVNHTCNGSAIRRIESLIKLIKQIEWGRIATWER